MKRDIELNQYNIAELPQISYEGVYLMPSSEISKKKLIFYCQLINTQNTNLPFRHINKTPRYTTKIMPVMNYKAI